MAVAGCGGPSPGGGDDDWTVAKLNLDGAKALVIDRSNTIGELYKITSDATGDHMVLVDYLDGAGQQLPALPIIHPVDWLYQVDDEHMIVPLARDASIKTFLVDTSTGAATDISAAGIPQDFESSVDQSRRLEVQTDHVGGIYFIDRSSGATSRRLVKVDTAHGNAVTTVSRPGAVVYSFRVDGAGNVVYADGSSNVYRVINAAGNFVTTFETAVGRAPYNYFLGFDDKFYFLWLCSSDIEIDKETILPDGTLQTPNEVYGTVPPGASGEDNGWFYIYTRGAAQVRLQGSIYFLDGSDLTISEVYNSSAKPALYPPVATFTSLLTSVNIVDWTDTNIYGLGQNGSTGVIVTYNPTDGVVSHNIANLYFDHAIVLADGTIYFAGQYNLTPILGKISPTDSYSSVSVIKTNVDIITLERLESKVVM